MNFVLCVLIKLKVVVFRLSYFFYNDECGCVLNGYVMLVVRCEN